MEAFEAFSASIEPFLPTWKSVEVRAVADEESGTLLSLVACLTPYDPHPTELDRAIPGMVFLRQALTVPRGLNRLMRGLEEGVVTLGPSRWNWSAAGFSDPRFMDISDSREEDLQDGWPDLQQFRRVALVMQGGRDQQQMVSGPRLDYAVAPFGFNLFSEFTLDRLGFRVGSSYSARVEIFAPLLAKIRAVASPTEVDVAAEIHTELPPEQVSIAYRIQGRSGNRLSGGEVEATSLDATIAGDFTTMHASIPIPDGGVSGVVQLFHQRLALPGKPVAVSRFSVPPLPGKANPRWGPALSVIGGTWKWTKRGIEPEQVVMEWLGLDSGVSPDPRDFERGVTVLLFAASVEVLPIGDADGVDHVAVPIGGSSATLVSCTVGPNLREKASKLKIQMNKLSDEWDAAVVRAAIFIPKEERDMLVGDIDECRANDIGLLLRPDLRKLFDAVRGPDWAEAGELFHALVARRRNIETSMSPGPDIPGTEL